jgi:predicted transcriptional regulator
MKTLKIGIADYDQMKARIIAIARGEHTPASGEPKVWFTSIESFARLLSEHNRHLLELIARERPRSLTELAEMAGRSKSNLSRTLKTMSQYGLVELRRGGRGRLVPRVPYDQVRLDVSLTGTRSSGSVGVSP